MVNVVAIVEGDGEVAALPILLRRLNAWLTPDVAGLIATPIRVPRMRFINRDEEFNRYLALAAAKCESGGWILILLDADDDCPAELGQSLLERAQAAVGHRPVAVVLANREYEAWFLAASVSLNGARGLTLSENDELVSAEAPRDAKGWLGHRMTGGRYSETRDQPAFSALMDLDAARARSRSFRKLCDEWTRKMLGADAARP